MANKIFINSDEIASIASSLKAKGDNILREYKDDCTSALNMSVECLQLSNLNTEEFFKALESIYTKLNEKITEFADFLNNTVVAEYDFTSQAIAANFNNDFAEEISGILGISVGSGAAVVGPTYSGGTGSKPASSGGSGGYSAVSSSGSSGALHAAGTAAPEPKFDFIVKCGSGHYSTISTCGAPTTKNLSVNKCTAGQTFHAAGTTVPYRPNFDDRPVVVVKCGSGKFSTIYE